jgi:organic hydroperoxide reductase OsmC/OhrA
MRIIANIKNSKGQHHVRLQTGDHHYSLNIAPKSSGFGSGTNGGELLFLAIATCFCNDIYREAAKRGMDVTRVEVTVEGEFGKEGEPATSISYSAIVNSSAPEAEIIELMRYTDTVSEIQNTLRTGIPVTLISTEAKSS